MFEVIELPNDNPNSARLQAQFSKIQSGLSGQKNQDAVKRVIGLFDGLPQALADEMMARTSFGVDSMARLTGGISDQQKRRNLARAIFFVSDMIEWFKNGGDKLTSEKRSSQEFEGQWLVKEASTLDEELGKRLETFNTDYVDFNRTLNAEFEQKPLRVVRVLEGPALRSFLKSANEGQQLHELKDRRKPDKDESWQSFQGQSLNQHLANRHERFYRETIADKGFGSSFVSMQQLYSSMRHNFQVQWSQIIADRLSRTNELIVAAEAAHSEFSGFFADQAAQKKAQLLMVQSACTALSNHAPWPVSLIGKAGGLAAGFFQVDDHLTQSRAKEDRHYYSENQQWTRALAEDLRRAETAVHNWRTIGVRAADLPNTFNFRTVLTQASATALSEANALMARALDEEFGSTALGQEARIYRDLYDLTKGVKDEKTVLRARVDRLTRLKETQLQQVIRDIKILGSVNPVVVQRFLELQLYAAFMSSIAPEGCDISSVAVPQALIDRLNSSFHKQLVTYKSARGNQQAAKIFGSGKLPWAPGHPRHVGGLVLFFRWYEANVNAFELSVGVVTVETIEESIRSVIVEIGRHVEEHRIRGGWFGKDTAEWDLVEQALNKR